MDKIIDGITNIIVNVLTALYQPFGATVILTFFAMYVYIYVKEHKWEKKIIIKKIFLTWFSYFKNSAKFRRIVLLVFYSMMILFRTILNRNIWLNPLSDVMGGWGLKDAKGQLTTESIENIMLFVPFIMLVLWIFRKELLGEKNSFIQIVWVATRTVGIMSLIIEISQLLFHLGTFQISDLVYNTLGGTVGGVIYYIVYKIRNRNK